VSDGVAALRHLRSIRHLVSATVFQSLVTALVLSRLDYGNGTLIGLPIHLIRRLRSVQNAAARLIFRLLSADLTTSWTRSSTHTGFTSAGKDCVQGCSADLPGTAR